MPSLVVWLSMSGWSADLRVGPGEDWADPQDAVDVAADGDRLLVFPGSYGRVALSRPIELVGVGGAATTVFVAADGPAIAVFGTDRVVLRGLTLDGDGVDRALSVEGGEVEVADAVLRGGVARDGGCLYVSAGNAYLFRTVVEDCTATRDGGGVWVEHADLGLTATTVRRNTAARFGGGLSVANASATLLGATIADNTALDPAGGETYGGGLYATIASIDVVASTFTGDLGALAGGGVYARSTAVVVSGSRFDDNEATIGGGGLALTGASLTLSGSRLSANRSADPGVTFGGAVFCDIDTTCAVDHSWFEGNDNSDGGAICALSLLDVRSSMFCANTATSDGGAIDLGNNDPFAVTTLSGNVFSRNTASGDGGALVVSDGPIAVSNNHFTANVAGRGGAVASAVSDAVPGLTVANNLFAGNSSGGAVVRLADVPYDEGWDWFWDNTDTDLDVPYAQTTTSDVDPELRGPIASCDVDDLVPTAQSGLVDGGDPNVGDPDGSRSDIGAFGGPSADPDGFADDDGDGVPALADCNDADPAISPDTVERCNGLDDDCDGLVDADDDGPDGVWVHPDEDGDGIGDPTVSVFRCPEAGWVGGYGEAVDPDPDPDPDPTGDADGDGLSDADEATIGSDPHDVDSDDDGLGDGDEGLVDSDGDGLFDPIDPDDDGDGWSTVVEGTDDFDGDGVPNYLDLDSDGDGAWDRSESAETRLDAALSGPATPSSPGGGCATSPGGAFWWVLLLCRQARSRRVISSATRAASAPGSATHSRSAATPIRTSPA